jgi:ribosomal protein S10
MGMQKQSLEFLAQVQKILDRYDFPLTIRQIFYQLVAEQIIPKLEKECKKVSRLCVKGRDEGILPEEKFVDRTRVFDKLSSWLDLKDFMDTVKSAYLKDKWQNQNRYIEIWTEKDALRSVINIITHKYDVGLQIARGQYPRTGIYETSLRYKAQSDKECFLYYVGDYDPSGLCIYDSIKERLIKHGVDVEIPDRLALTEEQIKKYKLPSGKAKKKDPNYKKFIEKTGSDRVVELDSLPPDILRKIIEDCIIKNIDSEFFGLVQEKEGAERIRLNKFIEKGI